MTEGKALKLRRQGGSEAAPDLLFLHGFGADRYAWTATTPAFEPSYRVWVAELPGHGENAAVAAVTPTEMAETVAAATSGLLTPPFHVVAHSLGGTVAIEMARRSPDLIDRAVLIAPLGLGAAVNESFVTGFAALDAPAAAEAHLRMLVRRPRLVTPQMAAHVLAFLAGPGHRDALRRIAEAALAVGRLPFPKTLAATIVWGEEDIINPADRDRLEALGLPVHYLPETGHLPQMEAIRETNALIAAALDRDGGSPSPAR